MLLIHDCSNKAIRREYGTVSLLILEKYWEGNPPVFPAIEGALWYPIGAIDPCDNPGNPPELGALPG